MTKRRKSKPPAMLLWNRNDQKRFVESVEKLVSTVSDLVKLQCCFQGLLHDAQLELNCWRKTRGMEPCAPVENDLYGNPIIAVDNPEEWITLGEINKLNGEIKKGNEVLVPPHSPERNSQHEEEIPQNNRPALPQGLRPTSPPTNTGGKAARRKNKSHATPGGDAPGIIPNSTNGTDTI